MIEPDNEVAAIGSGGPFAKVSRNRSHREYQIVGSRDRREIDEIAGKICIYTNENIVLEELAISMVIYLPTQSHEDGPRSTNLHPVKSSASWTSTSLVKPMQNAPLQ